MHQQTRNADNHEATPPLFSAKSRRALLLIGVALLLAWALLVAYLYQSSRAAALKDAETEIQNALLVHRALHTYIETIQKPEIYRLKDEGKLYPEYFSPKLLSFTYVARHVQDFLRDERQKAGLPPLNFKLAARNARNPINQTTPFEADLLQRMNEGNISRYYAVIERDGGRYLYLAMRVRPNSRSCMRCHGDPSDAPTELVAQYGDQRGFHEKLGEHRALLTIWVPVGSALASATRTTLIYGALSLLLLTLVFLVVAHFTRRFDAQQRQILAQNRQLAILSDTDALTGLGNRHKFERNAKHEVKMAHRYGTALSLILLDIDFFKRINDRHGHPFGDRILQAFANFIRDNIRETDEVFRWGGEEFAILLPHTDQQGAVELAHLLGRRLRTHTFTEGIRLTASLGVAQLQTNEDAARLLGRADRALYRAKQGGRDRVDTDPPSTS